MTEKACMNAADSDQDLFSVVSEHLYITESTSTHLSFVYFKWSYCFKFFWLSRKVFALQVSYNLQLSLYTVSITYQEKSYKVPSLPPDSRQIV
jgi:hypothetical protein